ncbi:hypothetical protein F4X33_10545 [Candidatus Poribacteria bacterium]|nr:hypothetical protein [Candidatus Poribacteria bacterium]
MPSTNHPSISDWLVCSETSASDNGAHVQTITEMCRPSNLSSTLAREIEDARFHPQLIADYAKVLGVQSASDLVHSFLPKGTTIRRGYFGEVLAASCLRDFDHCWIPVQKLRSMITSDQSLPGIDVLGAHVADDRFEALIFVEAKLRTVRDRRVVLDAAIELIADFERRYPSILHFAATELMKTQDPMYQPFLDYLKRREQRETEDLPYVYLVQEKGLWSEDDIELLEDLVPLPNGFRISIVEIDDLGDLVEDAYSAVGILVDDDDDE